MKWLPVLLLAAGCLPAQQYRAFWADAFHSGYKTPAQVDQMVEDLALARANAVFIEVRNRGGSYYLQSLEPPAQDAEYIPTFDALAYLIERAHARGIEVHAWFPVTPLWPLARPPEDPRHVWHQHGPNAPGDQMWMTVSSTGRVSTSMDPGHPDALAYLADVILGPAKHYDLDGLHLDYIRYPEDADYGWNPVAVARFARLENRTGSPPPADPRWSEFRRRQVTELVRQIYLRAFAIRPSLKISAALITWGNGPLSDDEFRRKDAYRFVFQDWRAWMEEGILDLGIPMNYFREAQNAAFFDRWLEYEKDRQYGRGILVGQAVYLNAIPDSLAQLRRALAPSAAGNRPLGVNFYSYASTNTLNASGAPVTPNSEFYRAAGQFFEESLRPPELAWKSHPDTGNIYGWLAVDSGPAWLKDGATVCIESDTGGPAFETTTDGSGFFGKVGLPPDRYRVRLERAGRELYRATPQDVSAGDIARFDIQLTADDFAEVIPKIAGAAREGERVVLTGSALAIAAISAAGDPAPELGRTQVVADGAAVPLFSVAPERLELRWPCDLRPESIVVRHAGLESQPFAPPEETFTGCDSSPARSRSLRAPAAFPER